MNCPQCHQPNPEGSKFCIHCGATLPAAPPAVPAPPPSYSPPQRSVPPPASSSSFQPEPAYRQEPSPPSPAQQPAPARPVSTPTPQVQRVIIEDINMTFSSMVVFMIKWALATIPALLILISILGIIILILSAIFSAVIGGLISTMY